MTQQRQGWLEYVGSMGLARQALAAGAGYLGYRLTNQSLIGAVAGAGLATVGMRKIHGQERTLVGQTLRPDEALETRRQAEMQSTAPPQAITGGVLNTEWNRLAEEGEREITVDEFGRPVWGDLPESK